MSRPEKRQRSGRLLGAVGVTVAVVAVVGLAATLAALDIRRREQIRELTTQLETLRHLVEGISRQLEQHGQLINTTLQAKSTPKSEPAEEVVYEDEYDYDDEEASYEYDEDDESNTKATVKRTAVLSGNSSSHTRTRRRRSIRSQEVPVHEERYVPSAPHLKAIFNSRSKPEGLRLYTSYFGYSSKNKSSPEQSQQLKYSITESTDHHNRPAHHKTRPHSSVLQEQERLRESVVRLRHEGQRYMNLDGPSAHTEEFQYEEETTSKQPEFLAAHFSGDASKYNQSHHFYYGNNILYHPHGLFKDWAPSKWMTERTISRFPIHNGKLAIQKSGIYFVYAQIYYVATHDRCGFHIKHNDREVAQCTSTASGRTVKRHSCFTALLLQLNKHDLLWISEVEGIRNTSFNSSHSFFGLIQLKAT